METVKLFFKEAWVLISSISWRDFIDIALVTIILFYAFRFIRDRRAGKLIVGVVLLVAVQVLSEICGLGTINFLLGNFFEVGVLAIIILFQPELRSALEKVGSELEDDRREKLRPEKESVGGQRVRSLLSDGQGKDRGPDCF